MYERFTSRVVKKLSDDQYLCTVPEAESCEAIVDFGNGKKQLVRLSSTVPGTFQEYQHLDGMLVTEGDEVVEWFLIGKVKADTEVLKFQSLVSRFTEGKLVELESDGELYLFERLT